MAPISRAVLPFLFAELVLCAAPPIHAQSEASTGPSIPGQPIPGTTGVSPFAGSVSQKLIPGVIPLSLQTAIDLGLKQNLGALLSNADIHSARGQRWQQLSALLPQVIAAPYVADSKINLAQLGFASIGGLNIPASIGPFSYFDARVAVSQSRATHEMPRVLQAPPKEWEPVFDAMAKECDLAMTLRKGFETVREFTRTLDISGVEKRGQEND